MTTPSDNQTESALQPPERIWLNRNYPCLYRIERSSAEDIEYARVTRPYFCSCGAALTAGEYIEHVFEKGHDRGDTRARVDGVVAIVDARRSCETYAEMIESQNDLSGQTENWADFHRGQHYAARQLAEAFRAVSTPAPSSLFKL